MRTLTLRRAAVVAVVPLALSTLAACGSGSSGTTAADPAAGPTSSAPASPTSISSASFLSTLDAAMKKLTTAQVTMSMDVSGQSVPIKGVIDMTGGTPAAQMSMQIPGTGAATEMRLVDKAVYIEVPGSTGSFYKIDLSDPNGPLSQLGGSALGNLDPGSMLAGMTPKVFAKVTDHGVASVQGQQLHHYTAQLDLGSLSHLPNLPSTAALPKRATYDAWLDDQGRLARFTMLIENTMRMTATYSDFGTAPHVVAPPASDVVAMPGTSASS